MARWPNFRPAARAHTQTPAHAARPARAAACKTTACKNCSRTWRVLRTWLSAKLLHAKLLPHNGGSYASGSLFYLISSPSSTSSPHCSFPNATTVVSNCYKLLPTQLQPASRFATSYGPVFFLHVTIVVTNCYNRRPTQLHLMSLFATSHGHHVFCYM